MAEENSDFPYGAVLGALLGGGKGYFMGHWHAKQLPEAMLKDIPEDLRWFVGPKLQGGIGGAVGAVGGGLLGDQVQKGEYEELGGELGLGLGGLAGVGIGALLPKKGRLDARINKLFKEELSEDMLKYIKRTIPVAALSIPSSYLGSYAGKRFKEYMDPYGTKKEAE